MNKHINALTATRGIAALLVVVFHFGLSIWPFTKGEQFFSMGNLAVSYFFVLSGFVMMWTYHDKNVHFVSFLKKRIARIVPLYIFAVLLCFVFILCSHFFDNKELSDFLGIELLLNVTFLQAYFPQYTLSINPPGWSLSVEMFFYLLFPLLLAIAQKNKKLFVVGGVLFFILSQVLHWYMVTSLVPKNVISGIHELTFYNPLLHLNQFVLGMLGVYLYDDFKNRGRRFYPAIIFLLIVLVVLFTNGFSFHNGLLAPLFILFIVLVVASEPRILQLKPLVFLGEISYGIYILQFPVYYYLELANKNLLHLNAMPYFYLYIVVLLSFSAICYRTIELPLRRKIANM